jgi:nucleoside-diphosphate-sugar epimerase
MGIVASNSVTFGENTVTTLVVGANGATGRLVVEQLLAEEEAVKVIIRSKKRFYEGLPDSLKHNKQLVVTEANLLNLSDQQLADQVNGCHAVISCLGHNLTWKGVYGHPRRLVTHATQRLCRAIETSSAATNDKPTKFILMNTTGNQNKQAGEQISIPQALIICLIRALVPPHADNENAARYLQCCCNDQTNTIEWVTVRPDSLIDESSVTNYEVYPSPICSAIFDSGKSSRINVAHFMSQLVCNNEIWKTWKYQMPVIYNTND